MKNSPSVRLDSLPDDYQKRIRESDLRVHEFNAARESLKTSYRGLQPFLRKSMLTTVPGGAGESVEKLVAPPMTTIVAALDAALPDEESQEAAARAFIDPEHIRALQETDKARGEMMFDDYYYDLVTMNILRAAQATRELLGLTKIRDTTLRAFQSASIIESIRGSANVRDLEEQIQKYRDQFIQVRDRYDTTHGTNRNMIDMLRRYEEKAKNLEEKLAKIIEEDPDSYVYVRTKQLQAMKEIFDANGTIVETEHVKKTIDSIRTAASANDPIFIHGELGTGKTEVAKHTARMYLSGPHLARWETTHPEPVWDTKEKGSLQAALRAKEPAALTFRKEHEAWEVARAGEAEPIVISGHRDLQSSDLSHERTMKVRETLSTEEKFLKTEEAWKDFVALQCEREGILPQSPEYQAILAGEQLFKKEAMRGFDQPVEIAVALSGVMKAMEEGRPIIIDELNAIPHYTLIALNDYLTYKPGRMVTPPSSMVEPFPVAEGFCVIGTGNWKPEQKAGSARYTDRKDFDAAFISRWKIREYDYLPNPPSSNDQKLLAKNDPEVAKNLREENCKQELYHMLVGRLLDTGLGATLPEDALVRLKELASKARAIQDEYRGKGKAKHRSGTAGGSVDGKEVLHENVLSLRHLVRVISAWKNDGFKAPLSVYLYQEYISRSGSRPEEQQFLYKQLESFFPKTEGWPEPDEPILANQSDMENLIAGMKTVPKIKSYSRREIITALYGPVPERNRVAQSLIDALRPPEAVAPEEVDEEVLTQADALRRLLGGVEALDPEALRLDSTEGGTTPVGTPAQPKAKKRTKSGGSSLTRLAA